MGPTIERTIDVLGDIRNLGDGEYNVKTRNFVGTLWQSGTNMSLVKGTLVEEEINGRWSKYRVQTRLDEYDGQQELTSETGETYLCRLVGTTLFLNKYA